MFEVWTFKHDVKTWQWIFKFLLIFKTQHGKKMVEIFSLDAVVKCWLRFVNGVLSPPKKLNVSRLHNILKDWIQSSFVAIPFPPFTPGSIKCQRWSKLWGIHQTIAACLLKHREHRHWYWCKIERTLHWFKIFLLQLNQHEQWTECCERYSASNGCPTGWDELHISSRSRWILQLVFPFRKSSWYFFSASQFPLVALAWNHLAFSRYNVEAFRVICISSNLHVGKENHA